MSNSLHSLQNLLTKYTKHVEDIHTEKEKIIQICKDIFGITLSLDEIEIEEDSLRIKAHPAKRQIVFMKKDDLLFSLQQQGFPLIKNIR